MAQINLAPGSHYVAAARRRRRILYALSALLLGILGAVWGTVLLLERRANSTYTQAKQELANVEANITREGENVKRITLFEQRLSALNQLLTRQHSWETLFSDLERLLPPETTLTSIEGTAENNRVIVAGRTPNIDIVAQTFASLKTTTARPTIFAEAKINNVQREEIRDADGNIVGLSYTFKADLITQQPPK